MSDHKKWSFQRKLFVVEFFSSDYKIWSKNLKQNLLHKITAKSKMSMVDGLKQETKYIWLTLWVFFLGGSWFWLVGCFFFVWGICCCGFLGFGVFVWFFEFFLLISSSIKCLRGSNSQMKPEDTKFDLNSLGGAFYTSGWSNLSIPSHMLFIDFQRPFPTSLQCYKPPKTKQQISKTNELRTKEKITKN